MLIWGCFILRTVWWLDCLHIRGRAAKRFKKSDPVLDSVLELPPISSGMFVPLFYALELQKFYSSICNNVRHNAQCTLSKIILITRIIMRAVRHEKCYTYGKIQINNMRVHVVIELWQDIVLFFLFSFLIVKYPWKCIYF